MRSPLHLCSLTESFVRWGGVCLIVILSAACSDAASLGPEDVSGEYTVVTANGKALPTYIDADTSQDPAFQLMGGRVHFEGAASVTLVLSIEHSEDTNPAETFYGQYYLDGSVLNFTAVENQQSGIGNKGLVLENGDILFYVQAPCSGCCGRRLVELVASRSPGETTTSGVEHFVGMYPMVEIDGVGAPLVQEDTTYASGERLVLTRADTITLRSDSTYLHSFHRYEISYASSDAPPDTTYVSDESYVGPYRLSEGAIVIVRRLPLQNGEISQIWHWGDDGDTIVMDARFNDWCPDGCPNWRTRAFTFRRE